jgi:hypothetical protein
MAAKAAESTVIELVSLVRGEIAQAKGAGDLNRTLKRVLAGIWVEFDGERLQARVPAARRRRTRHGHDERVAAGADAVARREALQPIPRIRHGRPGAPGAVQIGTFTFPRNSHFVPIPPLLVEVGSARPSSTSC